MIIKPHPVISNHDNEYAQYQRLNDEEFLSMRD